MTSSACTGCWLSSRRRDELDEEEPDHYADEHALGALVGHLISLTVGELPPWIVALAAHLMRWTDEAIGPHGENDHERDNRPHTWNSHFFDFLGILCVALPHDDVVTMFLEPITQFKDEAFHDAMAEFLRGFDRAMQATDAQKTRNFRGRSRAVGPSHPARLELQASWTGEELYQRTTCRRRAKRDVLPASEFRQSRAAKHP